MLFSADQLLMVENFSTFMLFSADQLLMVENFSTFEAQWDDSAKSKIALVHAVGGGVAPLILNLFTRIGVSVQLHDPAALPLIPAV